MDIFKAACGAEDYVIRCRRHIHEHPERSDQEEMTVAFISGELTRLGINHDVVPKGGVMGYIDGAKPGKTILLRADIDALPMQESPNNTKFPKACVSKIDGVAHTCGHDAHTAMLLGAASILHRHREELEGRVVLFFERGEEAGCGDHYLRRHIYQNNIHVDGAWAIHLSAALPVGQVGLYPAGVSAGAGAWSVNISNENGRAVDCGVSILHALNTIRMREVSPYESGTLTPCKIQFNGESCLISGTCRFHNKDKSGLPMKTAIRSAIEHTCAVYGCEIIKIVSGGPTRPTVNDRTCFELGCKAVADVLGEQAVVVDEPSMGAESFSHLAALYPSCYIRLGTGSPEKGMDAGGHNPHFDPDESAFKYGVAATVSYALTFLAHKEGIPFTPSLTLEEVFGSKEAAK